jgi:hypothetical protein
MKCWNDDCVLSPLFCGDHAALAQQIAAAAHQLLREVEPGSAASMGCGEEAVARPRDDEPSGGGYPLQGVGEGGASVPGATRVPASLKKGKGVGRKAGDLAAAPEVGSSSLTALGSASGALRSVDRPKAPLLSGLMAMALCPLPTALSEAAAFLAHAPCFGLTGRPPTTTAFSAAAWVASAPGASAASSGESRPSSKRPRADMRQDMRAAAPASDDVDDIYASDDDATFRWRFRAAGDPRSPSPPAPPLDSPPVSAVPSALGTSTENGALCAFGKNGKHIGAFPADFLSSGSGAAMTPCKVNGSPGLHGASAGQKGGEVETATRACEAMSASDDKIATVVEQQMCRPLTSK